MAYLTGYEPRKCRDALCLKVAAQELYRSDNESMGFYCMRHGAAALEDLRTSEAR
ncbi:hypothetical protein LCGC14_0443540 [marine sediment metagenome]|uniref:Uncharacterized protein n=1 Tax=marine sediment metagenome TaxID=412755 RepID=A0A0F9VTT2_9ZZZZ